MCGIAGTFGFDSNKSTKDLSHFLLHRGPDANGEFISDFVILFHTRLSILDLSSAANQPFYSADGRYVMVYNGEVYNYQELANKHAIPLKTSSDTEVIVELFARLGPGFVNELNGMFAIAIYNIVDDTLHLFRDRLGIKPLYTWSDGHTFAFASELPALKSVCGELEQDEEALSVFLHRGYIPEPMTLYKGIRKFPAGTWAKVEGGAISYQTYWKAEDHIASHTLSDEKVVIEQVHELLRDSVRLRLVADVPFGTFLSGGADSGLVSAIAAEVHTQPLNTFNVSFEDAAFNETGYAREMASIIGAKHHIITVTRKEVMDGFEEGLGLVGEPFADSSVFPTMAVSRFAAQHVKMALSGDGGDELFMGYGAYTWAARMAKPPVWAGRKLIAAALRGRGGNRNWRAANVFDAPDKAGLAAHIFSQEQNFFAASEITRLNGKPFRDPWTMPQLPRTFTPAEQQAFFDLTNYLKDDLLVKVDRSSMRYGLEVRVPFLDHRLVELALNIDPALKTKGGTAKYPIKKMMERYYPNHLIYRQKWGFSIPLEKWLRDAKVLDKVKMENEVKQVYFKELHKRYCASEAETYLYNRLYTIKALSGYI